MADEQKVLRRRLQELPRLAKAVGERYESYLEPEESCQPESDERADSDRGEWTDSERKWQLAVAVEVLLRREGASSIRRTSVPSSCMARGRTTCFTYCSVSRRSACG